jgi:hypothetical protein
MDPFKGVSMTCRCARDLGLAVPSVTANPEFITDATPDIGWDDNLRAAAVRWPR